jgi:radical SAM superfamily enzyme YgiQ (UPF0313 family)
MSSAIPRCRRVALQHEDVQAELDREALRSSRDVRASVGTAGDSLADIVVGAALLDLAVASGMTGLLVGFESVLPGSLREMNKHRTNRADRYRQQIDALQSRGVGVLAMFTFGFDEDGPDVFERTLGFCEGADVFGASFGILTPFPGTPTFEKLEAAGRIRTRDWRLYDLQHQVFDLPGWAPGALEAGVRGLEERYYSWPAFARRTARLRRYPRLLRPASLLLYATVNLQYFASLHRRRRGFAINTGALPHARPLPAPR